ncbi:MAG: cation diffusion facilitator family transporter [Xanthobacteraceae bacterium]|nr:cation diffusion facilitator family transporter [Xanthobacteraceae bacterium]
MASHEHHNHSHDHAPADFGRAFVIGTALNVTFVIVEVVFGLLSNSTALLADAGHNVSDILGLLVSWVAAVLAKRPPTATYTYGLRSSSILAALFNAMFLLVAVGAIGWEAVQRLSNPQPVASTTVMVVAGIGILVNGGTALMFMSGRKGDINIEGAFLHMAADAMVSAGVVIAALAILLTGWQWLDAAASLAICVVILWSTWGLLRKSTRMSLAAVPESIDPAAVRDFLSKQPGVSEIHDLHIWAMSTTTTALTCHLVMPSGHPGDEFLQHVTAALEHRFQIHHSTLQIEVSELTACRLAPDSVV